MAIGLLILRLVFGITLAVHSAQKLFGWFGGGGIAGTAPFMEQLGFRPGRLQAVLAGLVEAGGGLLLAAGLFSPLAAAMIIAVMLVASVTVHLAKGFFVQKGGYEYAWRSRRARWPWLSPVRARCLWTPPWGSSGLAPCGV